MNKMFMRLMLYILSCFVHAVTIKPIFRAACLQFIRLDFVIATSCRRVSIERGDIFRGVTLSFLKHKTKTLEE